MKKSLTELLVRAERYLGAKMKSPYFPLFLTTTIFLFVFVFPMAAFILLLALLILGTIVLRITRVNK